MEVSVNALVLLIGAALTTQCPGGRCPVPGTTYVTPAYTYGYRTPYIQAPVIRPITPPAPSQPAPAAPAPLGWHYTVKGWIYGSRIGNLVYPAA